jgi:uncharacterized protein (DUF488 family)
MMGEAGLIIRTIGHSTRSLGDFLELLRVNEIETVVDVRRFPFSRRHPHFNRDQLRDALLRARVDYVAAPELGGRRQPLPDSPNTAWHNMSFRGYADHMETDEFRSGIERLLEVGRKRRTAIMCAEALWWKCHRSLIADYLKSKGICVRHIIDGTHSEIHSYTPAARVNNGRLSYSSPER